ncbi:MAG: hypothetical protein KKG59_07630 [Nanoarchaeota archaeon]|nr:hypothetical protein [Nanoarchaeota archaeon]
MQKSKSKAQAWSIDLIIAGVIFILVITIFYTLLAREPKADLQELKREGNFIGKKLADPLAGDCAFLEDNEVNPEKIVACYATLPEDFKKENNINSKFCIYLVDQEGKIITVGGRVGFGDEDLTLTEDGVGGDVNCGEIMP